jgi:uncharacterized protein with PIN domain
MLSGKPMSEIHSIKETKFIADAMLGKLSKWLRILGFDTLYYRNKEDNKLLELAMEENRQILTRKTSLKTRKDIKSHLLFINENEPLKQLKEVIEHYKVTINPYNVFTLCLICNQKLEELPAVLAKDRVPEYVANTEKNFYICPHCKKIFWRGTHYKNMLNRIKETINTQP